MVSKQITSAFRQFGKTLNHNSPSILTGLGVAGFVTSIVMAVTATPKALTLIDKEVYFMYSEEAAKSQDYHIWLDEFGRGTDIYARISLLSKEDLVRVAWKCYIPTVGLAILSASSIIMANKIHLRRTATLASLYAIAESGLRNYQEKVVETIGANKEEKIRGEAAQKTLDDNPVIDGQVIITGRGEMLCYETLSGRYFKSDPETLRQAMNGFNERLLNELELPVNELYYDMGLGSTEMGANAGWKAEEGLPTFDFSSKLSSNNQLCLVVGYSRQPKALWF